MHETTLIPPGPTRRRAGTLLLAYGVTGLLLMGGLFAATLALAFMSRDGFTRIDETVDEVAAVLGTTSAALSQADTTLAGISVSLVETAAALDEAAAVSVVLRDGAGTLADQAGGFSILGQAPFEGMAQPLRDVAAGLEDLSARLGSTGAAIATNATDVASMAERLGAVAPRLDAVEERLTGVDTQLSTTGAMGVAVLLLIIAWLAVPAAAAVAIGRRWRRENPA